MKNISICHSLNRKGQTGISRELDYICILKQTLDLACWASFFLLHARCLKHSGLPSFSNNLKQSQTIQLWPMSFKHTFSGYPEEGLFSYICKPKLLAQKLLTWSSNVCCKQITLQNWREVADSLQFLSSARVESGSQWKHQLWSKAEPLKETKLAVLHFWWEGQYLTQLPRGYGGKLDSALRL